jgi:DNA-3-methyladenine glycosylase
VLFGPAGYAYVYAIYGRYFCMNITCEVAGQAGCVLLRALEPVAGIDLMTTNRGLTMTGLSPGPAPSKLARHLTSGPGRLCQAMGLTRPVHNAIDITRAASPLQVRDDGCVVRKIMVTARIGIRHAVDWPLRFAIPDHICVSGPRSLVGKCVIFE